MRRETVHGNVVEQAGEATLWAARRVVREGAKRKLAERLNSGKWATLEAA